MHLDELQTKVIDTIKENTSHEERFLSIDTLYTSLLTKNIHISRPELFTVLSSLQQDKRIEYMWANDELIYTLSKKAEEEFA